MLKEQAASGQSIVGCCREYGLRGWELFEWKKSLRGFDAAPFIAVEVSLPKALVRSESHSLQSSGIELRHRGGWSLMTEPGFDGHLRLLLSVLEQES